MAARRSDPVVVSKLGMHAGNLSQHLMASTPDLERRARAPCVPAIGALLEALTAAIGCVGVQWALHNPYCGLLFRCGCTWPWAGGWADCNYHNVRGPKCPWCNVRNTSLSWLAPAISSEFTVLAMLSAYGAVWLRQRGHVMPSVKQVLARGAAAVAVFVLLGLVLGWIFFTWSTPDYPCFLWIVDRQKTRCGGKA